MNKLFLYLLMLHLICASNTWSMDPSKTCYSILGIGPTASFETINQSYVTKILPLIKQSSITKVPPTIPSDIDLAYQVLKNPQSRNEYDDALFYGNQDIWLAQFKAAQSKLKYEPSPLIEEVDEARVCTTCNKEVDTSSALIDYIVPCCSSNPVGRVCSHCIGKTHYCSTHRCTTQNNTILCDHCQKTKIQGPTQYSTDTLFSHACRQKKYFFICDNCSTDVWGIHYCPECSTTFISDTAIAFKAIKNNLIPVEKLFKNSDITLINVGIMFEAPELVLAALEKGAFPKSQYVKDMLSLSKYKTTTRTATSLAILEYLLQYGANINVQCTQDGSTFLHTAVESKLLEPVVPLLLKYGADYTLKNREGLTAFELAHQKELDRQKDEWQATAPLLIKYSTSYALEDYENRIACSRQENKCLAAFEEYKDKEYINPTIVNHMGEKINSMYKAILNNDVQSITTLLKNKVNPNAPHCVGYQPLEWLSFNIKETQQLTYNDRVTLMKLFIHHGANPNTRIKVISPLSNGYNLSPQSTLIHWAVAHNDANFVQWLIQHHADYTIPNNEGETPAQIIPYLAQKNPTRDSYKGCIKALSPLIPIPFAPASTPSAAVVNTPPLADNISAPSPTVTTPSLKIPTVPDKNGETPAQTISYLAQEKPTRDSYTGGTTASSPLMSLPLAPASTPSAAVVNTPPLADNVSASGKTVTAPSLKTILFISATISLSIGVAYYLYKRFFKKKRIKSPPNHLTHKSPLIRFPYSPKPTKVLI